MLEVFIPTTESFDETTSRFITTGGVILHFEHSLLSLAKWESKYCKPFLDNNKRTPEEMMDYFRMMCLDEFDEEYWSKELIEKLTNYLKFKPTATRLNNADNDSNSRRIMTSELIYAYMVSANIPFSCEEWNLHRLFYLLGTINALNTKPKKMSQEEAIRLQYEINQKRLAQEEARKSSK